MYGSQKERWRELCEQLAKERDPMRFSQLVEELLKELHDRETRLGIPGVRGSAA